MEPRSPPWRPALIRQSADEQEKGIEEKFVDSISEAARDAASDALARLTAYTKKAVET